MYLEIVPEKYRDYYFSADENAKAPGFNKQGRGMIQEVTQSDIKSDLRYAVNSKNDISGQPRTFLKVDVTDPHHDDGLIYDEMLKEADIETRLEFYPECPHARWFIMHGLEIADRARIDTMVGFGWLLESTTSRKDAQECWVPRFDVG